MFRGNWIRMFIIAAMTMISVSLVGGVGTLAPRMRQSMEYMEGGGVPGEAMDEMRMMADGIDRLSYIFPAFFILVTCLVVFMTLTRMLETERSQIGTFKTLGYSRGHIIFRYVSFALTAAVVGNAAGVLMGHFVVGPVIFNAIAQYYDMAIPSGLPPVPFFGIVSAVLTLSFTVGVTYFTILAIVRVTPPAALLRPRAPRVGGKILLERMGPLWRRLPFRYKSSLRNIFRYRVRFFMTVFSMLFSTALVFMGMALSFSIEQSDPEIIGAVRPISSIIVIFAVLLNAMVIYNITNINIEERRREIATLKVLGYGNTEVVGYVFREIFMLTIIGVVIGLPVGYFTIAGVFEYLAFGDISYVNWYVWIIVAVLSFLSLALADLLLFKKIHKTDMNTSLKTVE